jgi:hypothetical protein
MKMSRNFEVRHWCGQRNYKPYLSLAPADSWRGDPDVDGEHSHVSVSACLSVSDAIALRDDLTKALIEIDAYNKETTASAEVGSPMVLQDGEDA